MERRYDAFKRPFWRRADISGEGSRGQAGPAFAATFAATAYAILKFFFL